MTLYAYYHLTLLYNSVCYNYENVINFYIIPTEQLGS